MKFNLGQEVRVKYFKDLAKENEVDSNGNITIGSCIFLREMKVYCGEVYKVKQVFGDEYELLLNDEGEYYFHKDMLELPNISESCDIDKEEKENEQVEEVKAKRQYNKKKV